MALMTANLVGFLLLYTPAAQGNDNSADDAQGYQGAENGRRSRRNTDIESGIFVLFNLRLGLLRSGGRS